MGKRERPLLDPAAEGDDGFAPVVVRSIDLDRRGKFPQAACNPAGSVIRENSVIGSMAIAGSSIAAPEEE
jgi:hypothetical protein